MINQPRPCLDHYQSRQGSNQYLNRVVWLQCRKVLFQHYFRECDESLIHLADRTGRPLTGQAFAEMANQAPVDEVPAAQEHVETVVEVPVEVPVTRVVRQPAQVRVVEKTVEVPVIQTVEKTVEVPAVVFPRHKVLKVPQVVQGPVVRERASEPVLPVVLDAQVQTEWTTVQMIEALVQTDWTMTKEVVVAVESDTESSFEIPASPRTTPAGRS